MTTKLVPSTEFHLIFEGDAEPGQPEREWSGHDDMPGSSARPPLVLSQGPARLAWDALEPAFFPVAATGSEAGPLFEPIAGRGAHPRLLLVCDAARPTRVNGLRAPRLTLLSAGDRLHFDDTCSFRVAIYYRPRLGPVPEHLIGVACPVCTIPLVEGDNCLVCPCGAPFHAAEDESAEGALACARMAKECPRCFRAVQTAPGYHDSHCTHP